MSVTAARSLSLYESTYPCQGSGLAASLAPRSWHEQRFGTSTEPQAQEGCLMSLSALAPFRPYVLSYSCF